MKNSFELKHAHRVLIVGNVFENNWANAQVGFAILFTPRNRDGTAPWSGVEDVTFTLNVVRHTGSGIAMLGTDDNNPSQPLSRVVIQNNLLDDVDESKWGGQGRVFQLVTPSDPALGMKIDHNTATRAGNAFLVLGDTTVVGDGFWLRRVRLGSGRRRFRARHVPHELHVREERDRRRRPERLPRRQLLSRDARGRRLHRSRSR